MPHAVHASPTSLRNLQALAWNEERSQLPVKYEGGKEAFTYVHAVGVIPMAPTYSDPARGGPGDTAADRDVEGGRESVDVSWSASSVPAVGLPRKDLAMHSSVGCLAILVAGPGGVRLNSLPSPGRSTRRRGGSRHSCAGRHAR